MSSFFTHRSSFSRFNSFIEQVLIKKTFFAAASLLLPLLVFGQSISIRGTVIDSLTNKPLSGVAVSLSNYKGTITNTQGEFNLSSQLSSAGKIPQLSVSYVGYRPMLVAVASTKDPITIQLVPMHKELPEVVISSNTKSIIERAIDRIPENYPVNPVIINGLLRVNVSVNDTDYFYKSDAVARVYAQSYKNGIDQRVEVVQNKTTTIKNPRSEYYTLAPVSFVGNFSSIADIVYQKEFFLNKGSLNDYIYFQYTKKLINDRVTYLIDFEKKRNNKIEGTVYIDSATLAFVRFSVKQYKVQSLLFLTRDYVSFEVNYRQYGTKWMVNDSYQETIYEKKMKGKEYVGFVANSYDTADVKKITTFAAKGVLDVDEKVKHFVHDSIWQRNEELFEKAESENRLTVVELPEIDTSVRPLKLGLSQTLLSYMNLENILFRLYGVQFPFSLANTAYSPVAAYGVGFGVSFRLYKTLFLQLNNEHNYGWGDLRTKTAGYRLSYKWAFNSRSNQSLVLEPFIGFSNVSIRDKGKNLEQRFSNSITGVMLFIPVRKRLQVFAETELVRSIKTHPTVLSIQPNSYALKLGVEFRF